MRLKRVVQIMMLSLVTLPAFGAVIKDINIDGDLKRTRENTILKIIGFNRGDEISDADGEAIRQRLIRSGLFVNEDIKVDLGIDGEEASLSLFLKDRFSTVPIPLLTAGDGGIRGGLYLVNMNLFGTGNQLYAGGLFGKDFRYAAFSYTDTSVAGSSWDLGGGFDYFADTVSITSVDGDDDLYKYDVDLFRVHAVAKWKRAPWSLRLKVYGVNSEFEGYDGRIWGVNPKITLGFDATHYRDFLAEGVKGFVKYGMGAFSDHFETNHMVDIGATGTLLPFERVGLELDGAAKIYRGDVLQSVKLSSLVIPQTVRAENFYRARAGITLVPVDFSWAYIALPIVYELGYMDGISAEDELFHGPAAGLTLNLKEVAIPAISLYYGWNVESGSGVFRFSLGFQK